MFSLTIPFTLLTEVTTKTRWRKPGTASRVGTPNVRFVALCLAYLVSDWAAVWGTSRPGLLGVLGRTRALAVPGTAPRDADSLQPLLRLGLVGAGSARAAPRAEGSGHSLPGPQPWLGRVTEASVGAETPPCVARGGASAALPLGDGACSCC